MKLKQKKIFLKIFKDLFDFSNYPKDSMLYDLTNMNKIGKMKDESEGKINIEFVWLKSKMYSLLDVDGKEIKTRKGINTVVVENIKHKEYPNVLINKKIMRHKIKRIQSKLHKIGTYDVYKIFSCFDDKRYILDDGIKNFAYYNKDIRSQ